MRNIDDLIDDWKTEFGTMSYGKHGAFYRYINWKIEKNLLMNLAQTLIDEGFKKEDLVDEDNRPNAVVQMKVVNACAAPDGASSRKKSEIAKSKRITAANWKDVLKEFFRGAVSTHVPEDRTLEIVVTEFTKTEDKKLEKTKEELLEEIMNPKDRLVSTKKIDRSNDTNWELLAELGIEPDEASDE